MAFDADAAVNTLLQTAADLADEVRRLRARVAELEARGPVNRKKLSKSDVRRIREWNAGGVWTQKALAEMFAVNPATISRIVRGQYHGA